MSSTIGRRRALNAGNRLNDAARLMLRLEGNRVVPEGTARDLGEAVRVANEIMFQYYRIPRAVRETYAGEGQDDGVHLCAVPEGGV